MVITRSPDGIHLDNTLSTVVLPVPVPPEIRMFNRQWTQALRNVAISGVMESCLMRPSTVKGTVPKRRMLTAGPQSDKGRMMALTREPSASRASSIGEL